MREARKTDQETAREELVGVERKQAVNAESADMPTKTDQKIDGPKPARKTRNWRKQQSSQQVIAKPAKITPLQAAILEAKAQHPSASIREIAKLTDCDNAHVCRVLARFGIEQSKVRDYKQGRADILAGIQGKILESISSEDIKKASLNQKVVSIGILYDKERLERDKSTVIVGYDHQAMADRLAELRQMLADVTEAEIVD